MTDYDPNDDIQDERIRALAASHYNAPEGTVPRDAMWEQISAARRAARTSPAEPAAPDATVIPLAPRRGARTIVVWRWSAALAAGLILAFVLGRELGQRDGTTSSSHIQLAQQPARSAGPTDSAPSIPPGPSTGTPDVTQRTPGAAPRRVASAEPVRPVRATGAEVAARDSVAQTLYRAAAIQTLVQAEAVLTAYRGAESGASDPQVMQQSARWARDVLSSTRLLMDSPAGRDPRMRALFSDLELVLAQIVQLSGTPLQASERELIDRAMRDRDLLPRLRSAVPAGLAASS
jgi:hypothetical protein